MRYVTHQFAHAETLDRASRWLIQAGIAPDRILTRHHGIPSLAVAAEPGEVDGIEMVICAAERGDPDGVVSFWDLAGIHPAETVSDGTVISTALPEHPGTFPLAWHGVDTDNAAGNEAEWLRAYREARD